MKNQRRIALHALFWIVYFAVNLFNELYLSSSFTAHPSSELLFDSIKAQLLVLTIKIPAVYYVLYSLIPRWSRSPSRIRLVLEFSIAFLLLVLCYRALVQFIIWPYIVRETPPPLSSLQYLARFFYSLLDLLQVTGIAAAIKLFRLRIAAANREKKLMQEKLQSEMQHLRAQINPHFLFNTLNSIFALSRQQSTETPDAVMRLSRILRFMLYASEQKTITVDEELKITMDYIGLQEIRFGSRVQLCIEKNIDDYSAQLMPQILLPLVENSFKHGTSDVTGAVKIRIDITLRHQQLKIEVANPLGTSSVTSESNEGIGLQNIQRRLELLYHDYSFHYGRKENNFVVELNVNLNSYANLELPDR